MRHPASITRRSFLGLMTGGAALWPASSNVGMRLGQTSAKAEPAPAATRVTSGAPVPLSHFGVDRFSTRDQQAALVSAFAAAGAEGLMLVGDPDARYRHDGLLNLNAASFDGQGCVLIAAGEGPQALRCVGSNWRVANVTLLGAARQRHPDPAGNGVWVGDEGEPATDFSMENVRVGSVEASRGFAGTGYMFINAHRGRINGAHVQGSLADGIHITGGSTQLIFQSPICRDTGDDGFAVVSYRSQNKVCSGIRIIGGESRNAKGRGLCIAGGHDILYDRCRAVGSSAAGLYLFGEGGWDTFGLRDCRVTNAVLEDCVTGVGQEPNFRHSVVLMGGREGEDVVDGLTLQRGCVDCSVANLTINRCGSHTQAAISIHDYAVRPILENLTIRDMISPSGRDHPNGIQIGGKDVRVDGVDMTNIGGIPITCLPSASGRCIVRHAIVEGGRTRPGGIDSFLYFEPAPRLTELRIEDGRFAGGAHQLVIDYSGPGKLRMRNNRLNGIAVN